MKKVIISCLLVCASIVGAYALSSEEIAANFLASKGFINDKSSNPIEYRLTDNITRKEVMKIIAKVANLTVSEKCEGKFSDVVDDWGCKYIEAGLAVDYISFSNGKFRPDDKITKTEVMKLIFKSRGIKKIYNTDNWQKDYADTAYDLGITPKYTDYNADAKRGWIFETIYNTYEHPKTKVYSDEL